MKITYGSRNQKIENYGPNPLDESDWTSHMENENSKRPESFHKENKTIISIIGIGNEAARMVDRMQVYNFPGTELHVLCTDSLEKGKCSLPNEYSIDTPELGDKFLSCFIVGLGNDRDEACIKSILQKAVDMETKAKILIVTLPHSSEGVEKREKTLALLASLEELVDGIFMVDYDSLQCNTIQDVFEEGIKRVLDFVHAMVSSMLHALGVNDVVAFLKSDSCSKYMEHLSVVGDLNYLKQKSKDLCKCFPSNYGSLTDISSVLFLVSKNPATDESAFKDFLSEVLLGIMQSLNEDTSVRWGIYDDSCIKVNNYRLDIFTRM